MIEKWKIYKCLEISNLGQVKRNGCIIKYATSPGRYIQIRCGDKERKFLHKLVAELFIPNPYNKPQVDHIDGNTLNNRVDNLRWVTQSENNQNPHWIYKQKESQINKKHRKPKVIEDTSRMGQGTKGKHWYFDYNINKRVYF